MKSRYLVSCAFAAILCGGNAIAADRPDSAATAQAPDAQPAADAQPASAGQIDDVIVTAQRRDERIQDVPATIQAFSGASLDRLNVHNLDDFAKYVPNVSLGTNGPGQGAIFIRGLSSGFAGNQSSATIGLFPNVAIYLDEQSLQFPGRNVDIYPADLQRIEVLEGPQGTLFGGGAQAGAVRYITNKPNLDHVEGSAEGSYGFTSGGAQNTAVTATLNLPIIRDKLAVRLTVYNDRRGGYIDNVQSTFTRSNIDPGNNYLNIRPNASGICPNGLPAGPAGLCTLAGAPVGNNSAIAGADTNPVTYTGGRVSLAYKIAPDWDVLISESLQNLDAEGVFSTQPIGSDFQPLGPLQQTVFTPSYDRDKYSNTAWTLNGKLAGLKLIYTGGFTDRRISQQQDYTNYSRTAYGVYYTCQTPLGLGSAGKPIICYSPVTSWQDTVRNTHLTNEFRISTPDHGRLRAIGGLFYEDFKVFDVQNFNYKNIPSCTPTNLAASLAGGPDCVANVRTAPGSTANQPGIRGDNTGFGEDVQRGYTQFAVFASLDFDIIPHVLTISGGSRYFRYTEFEVGSQYATPAGCLNVPNGQCVGGLVNIDNNNDHQTESGFRSRANLTWHVNPQTIAYFTFSQGFRPGGFNRTARLTAFLPIVNPTTGAVSRGPAQFLRPNSYLSDSLNNYEIGVKTSLFNRRLQLNVSAYIEDWSNVQFAFFNPTQLGNTTFNTNGPDYEVKGIEVQFTAKPIEGLTIDGSGAYNDSRQTSSPSFVNNVVGSPGFGQVITQVFGQGGVASQFVNPFGTIGSVSAFSPYFHGSTRARYDWRVGPEARPFVQVGVNYTGFQFNEPSTYPSGVGVVIPNTTQLRYRIPGYATLDGSIGLDHGNWHVELYGTNLVNSHASTFTSSAQFIRTDVPIRPRVFALKIGYKF